MEIEPYSIAGTVDTRALSEEACQWAESRRLSPQSLAVLGAKSGTVWFPEVSRKERAIFFPFQKGWKARSIESKSYTAGGGFKSSFFNLEAVLLAEPDTVFITEGEIDCAALVEGGIQDYQVLSVPNGARERPEGRELDFATYAYVDDALKAGLSKVKRFVWCGDNDTPGLQLREDMAKVLGAARFMFVSWPPGVKDANQYIMEHGAETLHEFIVGHMRPWPVHGLFRMEELVEPSPLTLWELGFPSWEGRVRLAPRTLSIVTGRPGEGKTIMFQQLWQQVIRKYDLVAAMASFETRPKPHLRKQIRGLFCGKPEWQMSDLEKEQADRWISDHYLFMLHPESKPTIGWFLDMAEVAVIRHGAKIIQLDPFNRMESARSLKDTETEYILRFLREAHQFAHDMNVHLQIIAHPAKMDQRRRGEIPDIEDISGSMHWKNICDQAFVVYRPEIFDGLIRKTECSLIHKKARFEELGYPCQLDLNYNIELGKFFSRDTADMTNEIKA